MNILVNIWFEKGGIMSLINNIPFDINRTPVEKNTSVKRRGTIPVSETEFIHPTEKEVKIKERRNSNRRKYSKKQKFDRRTSAERRNSQTPAESKVIPAENNHQSGTIIDLEV